MRFDRYVGLPFCDRGRDLAGVDCWGLLRLVYLEQLGVALPSYAEAYATSADRAAIAALIDGEASPWREIEAGAEQMFDGVLMREGRFLRHIGLVVEPGRLLHVDRGLESRIEPYRSGLLAHRVAGFYRLRR